MSANQKDFKKDYIELLGEDAWEDQEIFGEVSEHSDTGDYSAEDGEISDAEAMDQPKKKITPPRKRITPPTQTQTPTPPVQIQAAPPVPLFNTQFGQSGYGGGTPDSNKDYRDFCKDQSGRPKALHTLTTPLFARECRHGESSPAKNTSV